MFHLSSAHTTAMTLLMTAALPLAAAEMDHDPQLPRAVGELMVGTAGFEPGLALEWRLGDPRFMIRPEVFRNTDSRAGGGLSLGWDMDFMQMDRRNTFSIGPRIVYHNADKFDWEADAMGIWHFDLVPSQPGRHFLEVIGTLGAVQKNDEGEKTTGFAGSAGIAYGYQF